jgi:multiple sugar transport system substrate-binding protein
MKRALSMLMLLSLLLAACGGAAQPAGDSQPTAAAPAAVEQPTAPQPADQPTAAASTAGEQPSAAAQPASGEKVILTMWTYQAPDDPVLAAYEKEFEAKFPNIDIQHTAVPEDDYQTKIETALTAHDVPDIAFIENKRWMKAGEVVDLTEHLRSWGVDPQDFNTGGLARLTWDLNQGIFAVGDFLGGNVIFYNKDLFDKAGIPYPDPTKSLSYPQYADLCTKLATPDPDPAKAIWGCTTPHWGLGINQAWVFGKDGRTVLGNLNSPETAQAYELTAKLERDGVSASEGAIGSLGSESDLFAQGKLAMTWSDFTEATKYKNSGIKFGIMPFYVLEGKDSFVDTWTSPWGTFKDSKHQQEALEFLHFIATDAQTLRPTVSSDPPLSTKVAQSINWGKGDSVTEEYLKALSVAPGQPFVPPLPEGLPWDDVWTTLQEDENAKAGPLLDDLAQQVQEATDQAWKDWDQLGK